MGPIRAFSRPSHCLAAAEFVASASPYGHSQGYAAARRPYIVHPASSLGAHPSALPHPHLYGTLCVTDPLHVGLVSSPAVQPTCLFHFKKLLPPGAVSTDTRLAAPGQQDTGGASQGAARDAEGGEGRKRDILERGRSDNSTHERKSKEERKAKHKSGEKKQRKVELGNKIKKHNGAHKRQESKPDAKCEQFGDNTSRDQTDVDPKWNNKHVNLTWNKPQKEHQWTRNEQEHGFCNEGRDGRWSKDKVSLDSLLCPAAKADDPCTSRMSLVFPFSDDDDDGCGHEGAGEKGNNEDPWPISDIVETEDEEGDGKPRHAEDPRRGDIGGDGPSQRDLNSAEGDAAAKGVPQQQQLTPGVNGNTSDLTQNGSCESEENLEAALPDAREWQESPQAREAHDEHKDYDTEEELQLEEKLEHDNEDKRSGEEDWPRDGVRATQRLRPRSYRQFLLTRERRSRVFLKARSYHLGRWFVTHFTHPYPTKEQKDQLAARTSMTRNQVSEWFGNMRRRIREATRGLGVCWEERVRLYNSVITGKSEPLPIQPGDAINTWVPPVAEEPPSVDAQEEVCASPKFKKALMQRYLNNSFEAPPSHASQEDARPCSLPAALTPLEEDVSLGQRHHDTSEPPISSPAAPQHLPLCTSSPKESFQARWNTSFQQVRDNKFPAVTARLPEKTDARARPFGGGRGQGEEDGKTIKTYERHKSQGYSCGTFKRQKTHCDYSQSSDPCTSSSLLAGASQSHGTGWRTLATTSAAAAHLQSSPWLLGRHFVDLRSSDEEDAAGCYVRKPEELAAAYTLMELHTDTPAAPVAHHLVAAPRPPPLSS